MAERNFLQLYPSRRIPQADPSIDFNDPAQKIPTPCDHRGLIVVEALVSAVKGTVAPSYRWSGRRTVHHLYYYEDLYPSRPFSADNPRAFRDLPPHIVSVPKDFEEWCEKVMLPADVPDPEVRTTCLRAWSIARGLYRMASYSIRTERQANRRVDQLGNESGLIWRNPGDTDEAAVERMADRFVKQMSGFELHMEWNAGIPEDYRYIDVNASPEEAARQLGRCVVRRSRDLWRPLVLAA